MDRIDRQLLILLQRNNRRRLRDLAAELAVSAPTCLRRMRRLEQLGVIRAMLRCSIRRALDSA